MRATCMRDTTRDIVSYFMEPALVFCGVLAVGILMAFIPTAPAARRPSRRLTCRGEGGQNCVFLKEELEVSANCYRMWTHCEEPTHGAPGSQRRSGAGVGGVNFQVQTTATAQLRTGKSWTGCMDGSHPMPLWQISLCGHKAAPLWTTAQIVSFLTL